MVDYYLRIHSLDVTDLILHGNDLFFTGTLDNSLTSTVKHSTVTPDQMITSLTVINKKMYTV